MASKNLVQYLESIEENTTKKTISDQIGEDFREYLKNSKVYYYESDIRKFNNKKRKDIYKTIGILVLYVFLLIFNIVNSDVRTVFNWRILIPIILILNASFALVYTAKRKDKVLANSKFNRKNIEFYEHNNILETEIKNTLIYFLNKILFIILIIVSFVLITILGILSYIEAFLPAFLILIYGMFLTINYEYSEYMFETETSYVVTNLYFWKKYNK